MRKPDEGPTVNSAVVADGEVTAIVSAPPGWAPEEGELVTCGYEVQAGWLWDGQAFSEPALSSREIHVAWFKAALAEMEVLDAVDAAVRGLPQVKQVLWEYATTIREDDADVAMLALALGIDLSEVFDRADTIRIGRGS